MPLAHARCNLFNTKNKAGTVALPPQHNADDTVTRKHHRCAFHTNAGSGISSSRGARESKRRAVHSDGNPGSTAEAAVGGGPGEVYRARSNTRKGSKSLVSIVNLRAWLFVRVVLFWGHSFSPRCICCRSVGVLRARAMKPARFCSCHTRLSGPCSTLCSPGRYGAAGAFFICFTPGTSHRMCLTEN